MANLVILESPNKVGTVKSYLGSNYKVIASVGHIRDLPKSSLGVDIEHDFAPHYINIRGKGDLIKSLKKEVKHANKVFLATDPDREGEAIAWHLVNALNIPPEKIYRATFNAVTKSEVKAGIKNPRQIDMNLVNAQQARRILDRIVGYKLSPFLWKTVKSGLSAGRVQSVATRVIVDREAEIRAFVPEEYWTIDVGLGAGEKQVGARFWGNADGKMKLSSEAEAQTVVAAAAQGPFTVQSIRRATRHKAPTPPFITSTLQQEAWRKLGFQSQRIMRVAQELYEGINLGAEFGGVQGLITYMRTDSLRVAPEAQEAARAFITEKYGANYIPETPRVFKSRSNAQDAHEAIRPTRIDIEPQKIKKSLTQDQFRLYRLIWERFIASQMESAELNTITADFAAQGGYLFRTSGYTVKFQGYMAVYEASEEEDPNAESAEQRGLRLPDIAEGETMTLDSINPQRHFTEPPPRYNEGSLVKFLEEKGIGRPATYAQIISTIISRDYVTREGKALMPTPLGELTTKIMKEKFPDIVDCQFTASMETDLDEIERGEETLNAVLADFWAEFEPQLTAAQETMANETVELPVEQTDMICDKCGATMIVKNGRYGKFAACPNYPTCKNTKPLGGDKPEAEKPVIADFKCELCGADMVLRSGRYGSFYACSRYPECKFTKQRTRELDVPCPKCGAKLVTKYGRGRTVFYSCERYPDCDFSSWDLPTAEKCPDCGGMLFRKKGKNLLVCADKACGYKREVEPEVKADAESEANHD